MPSSNDESQTVPTLPPAELNPLLNPLLAENMGRWAEVYFTTPPEKREQAVLELLRELEAKNGARELVSTPPPARLGSVVENPAQEQSEFSLRQPQTGTMETEYKPASVHCESCGRDNPPSHKFCGMCGAKLESENNGKTLVNEASSASEYAAEHDPESAFEPSYHYTPSSASALSLFQNAGYGNYDNNSEWEYEPASSSWYRIYLGLALAMVILALGYVAWRASQGSQASQSLLPPPPAATREAEPATAAPKAADDQPQSAPAQKSDEATTQAALKKQAEPAAKSAESEENKPARNDQPPAPAAAAATANAGTSDQTAPADTNPGNGGQELAIAQRYLNGTSGQRRDGAEAAKWLWKSIAKHNSEATLLLADLYLKGDGVSKNCDQARVLLDSAARKGMTGAGERLRNLQAFGCQ